MWPDGQIEQDNCVTRSKGRSPPVDTVNAAAASTERAAGTASSPPVQVKLVILRRHGFVVIVT